MLAIRNIDMCMFGTGLKQLTRELKDTQLDSFSTLIGGPQALFTLLRSSLKARLIYRVSSRTTRATQRNSVFKNQRRGGGLGERVGYRKINQKPQHS